MVREKAKTPDLTAVAVKNAKPRVNENGVKVRREIADGGRKGLYLIVQPSGAKSWALRSFHAGKHYKLTIGSADVIPLAEARKQATKALAKAASGTNPAAEKKEARAAAEAARKAELDRKAEEAAREKIADEDQFERRYETYRVEHIEKEMKATTAKDVKRIFERDVLPEFRLLRLNGVRKSHIEKLLKRIGKEKGPYAALRLHALLNHFFGFFEKKTYEVESEGETIDVPVLVASPMRTIPAPSKAKKRKRVLTDDEIRWFWKACDADCERKFEVGTKKDRKIVQSTFGRLLQLILLNATRRDEVRCMSRSEFGANSGDWKLPSERAKNGIELLIPMAPASIEILESLPRIAGKAGFVFTVTGKTPVSGLSKSKKRIEKAMLEMARAEAEKRGENPDDIEIPAWRIHDLRRTARTNFSRLGIRGEVAERCIGHIVKHSDTEDTYNLYDFRAEKADAFAKWAEFIERLVNQKPANIIELAGRRATT